MRAHGFDSRNSTPNSHRISRAVKDNSNRSKRSRAWKFYCSSKEFEAFCDSRKGGSGHFRNIELRWFLSNSKNRFDTDKIKKCVDLNIYDDSVDSNIGIATFNLGETGFPDSGERDISKMMLQHGIHILACQETHEPPDSKGRVIPECLWLNKPFPRLSAKKDCMHGLSFCIREDIGHLCCRLKSDLLDSNEETQWIRVRKRFGEYITLCNVYMPLHRKSVSEKRELFNKLSNEYNEIRNRFPMDEIYIMGDFNSKCGMLIGDWGSGIPDTKNSELFLNLINVNNMTVHEPLDLNNKHTRYPRCRQSGSPSIIDYIVSNKGQTNKYECINTMDDFGIDSDHRLLKFSIDGSLSFKAINKKMKSQLKLSVLKFKPDVQKRFHKTFDKLQFSRRIKSIIRGSKNSSKTRLERITHCSKALSGELRKLCAKICGTTSINTYTKHWIDDKCRSLMNKLKRLRKTNASDDRIKYTQKRLHKHIRKCKKDHINDLIKEEISKIRENIDPTRLWKFIDKLCHIGQGSKISNAINTNGKRVFTDKEINAVFSDFANKQNKLPDDPMYGYRTLDNPVRKQPFLSTAPEFEMSLTVDDIFEVRRKLSNGKASGLDKCPAELFKYAGSADKVSDIDKCLLLIFKECLEMCKIPHYWRKGVVTLLFKKGDRALPQNYRPITLLPVIGKIFTRLLSTKVMSFVEKHHILSRGQNGFRRWRSCNQHIFTLIELCEKVRNESNHGAFVFFLDLKKCFDRVNRKILYRRMREAKINKKTVDIIKYMNSHTIVSYRTNSVIGDPIQTERGVPQGCCIAPCTYLFFADMVLQELNAMDLAVSVGIDEHNEQHDTGVLMYADDLCIVCDNADDLQKMIDRVAEIMTSIEMEANISKCAVLHMKHPLNNPTPQFTYNGNPLLAPDEYVYLGATIDTELSWTSHMNKLKKKSLIAYARLKPFLCNPMIDLDLRLLAFDALITPLFGYASESWAPTVAYKRKELDKLYDDILCKLIDCPGSTDMIVIHALCGTNNLKRHHTYFRMLFKYRNTDCSVGSLHTDLFDEILDKSSKTTFARWFYKDKSFDFMFNDDNAPSNHEIRAKLQEHYVETTKKKYCSPGDNKSFLHKYILADRERLKSNRCWAPRKWTSSSDFKIMCSVFGGSSKLGCSKLCFRCGAANSFEHSLRDCSLLEPDKKIDFENMFETAEGCKSECEALRRIFSEYNKNKLLMNLSRKRITVFIKNETADFIVLAPLLNDKHNYRVIPLNTNETQRVLNITELHKTGAMFVHPGLVNLEDYL